MIIRAFIAMAVLLSCWFVIPVYGMVGIGYIWLAIYILVAIAITPRIVSQAGRFGRVNGSDREDIDNF